MTNRISICKYVRDGKELFDVHVMVDGLWVKSFVTDSTALVEREISGASLRHDRAFEILRYEENNAPTLYDTGSADKIVRDRYGYEPDMPKPAQANVWDYFSCMNYVQWRTNTFNRDDVDLILALHGGYMKGNDAYYTIHEPEEWTFSNPKWYAIVKATYELWHSILDISDEDLFWVSW